MAEFVRSTRDGAHVVLTIDAPPANAISRAVIAELRDGLRQAAIAPGVRAVVITGAGPRFFAAGADVREFANAGGELIAEAQMLTIEMEALAIPIIAAVNGVALGGGCELTLAADIRIASTVAQFGQPEINLGIIPGWGGTQRLPRLIGKGPAMALLLTGAPVTAARALELGLVTEVVEPERLMERAAELAELLATKAPLAVTATKEAVNDGLDRPLQKALDGERGQFIRVFKSADAREGVSAFLEKRTPTWRGE